MRLSRQRLRGINTFTLAEPVDIDFEALGPGLVAITGDNGEGKTTLIEAPAAALYRFLPSRDTWYEYFRGRDAFIETTFTDAGRSVQARVNVDAEGRKTERYILVDGVPTSGKKDAADTEAARLFGSRELYLVSILGAQKRTGNFLDAIKGERKARFAELLGLSRLEALAASARAECDRAGVNVGVARAERDRLVERLDALGPAQFDLDMAMQRQGNAASALETARKEETVAVATLERARGAAERIKTLRAAAGDTVDAMGTARSNHINAEAALARDRTLVDLQAEIPLLEAARDALPEMEEEDKRHDAAAAALVVARTDSRIANQALATAKRRHEDGRRALDERLERLTKQAALLDKVPCTAREMWPLPGARRIDLAGSCPLLTDAREAAQGATSLVLDPSYEQGVALARAQDEEAGAALNVASKAVDSARAAEVKKHLVTLRAGAARLPAAQAATAAVDVAASERRVRDAKADLERATRRVNEAAEALGTALGETTSYERADAALSWARQARIDAERGQRAADGAATAAQAALDGLRAIEADLPAKKTILAAYEEDLGEWTLLEKALGRDGIQALEIDAAGPEVARLVNELLQACYGTRWSIAFETLREKRSSPGEYSEAFDIRIFDRGEERTVDGISGGERVIVGEAIALALATYNARKSGIAWETIFRDETSGALSPANAQAYADMLRRALQLGGFYQVIFISHQPEVVARADVRLVVAGGRVTVEGAPPRVSAVTAVA